MVVTECMEKTLNNVSYRGDNHTGDGTLRSSAKMPVYTTDKRRNKFSQRTNKKWIRLATVFGYMVSVSAPAVMLSMYYVCFWDPSYVEKFVKNNTNASRQAATSIANSVARVSRSARDLAPEYQTTVIPSPSFTDITDQPQCQPCNCPNIGGVAALSGATKNADGRAAGHAALRMKKSPVQPPVDHQDTASEESTPPPTALLNEIIYHNVDKANPVDGNGIAVQFLSHERNKRDSAASGSSLDSSVGVDEGKEYSNNSNDRIDQSNNDEDRSRKIHPTAKSSSSLNDNTKPSGVAAD